MIQLTKEAQTKVNVHTTDIHTTDKHIYTNITDILIYYRYIYIHTHINIFVHPYTNIKQTYTNITSTIMINKYNINTASKIGMTYI